MEEWNGMEWNGMEWKREITSMSAMVSILAIVRLV